MKLKDLSIEIGVSIAELYRIEKGERNASPVTLSLLESFLGLPGGFLSTLPTGQNPSQQADRESQWSAKEHLTYLFDQDKESPSLLSDYFGFLGNLYRREKLPVEDCNQLVEIVSLPRL